MNSCARPDSLRETNAGSQRFPETESRLGARLLRDDGTYWQILSPETAAVFGSFGGIGSVQRSTPRWVQADKVESAVKYVRSLP